LPLAPASQAVLVSGYTLEGLPFDQLYMLLSEARRVVRPGGHWCLLHRAPPASWPGRLAAAAARKCGSLRLIEANHYLSPEDWESAAAAEIRRFRFHSRLLLLKRL
jgi:hypothetical protein